MGRVLRYIVVILMLGLIIGFGTTVPVLAAGTIEISSVDTGPVGTSVTIQGTGFTAGENVVIYYSNTGISDFTLGSSATTFSKTFNIPPSTTGNHNILAEGSTSGLTGAVTFSVTPNITLSTSSGKPGDSITVNGYGFASNETNVKVTFNGNDAGSTTTASSVGSWTNTITVPSLNAGTYNIGAYGNTTSVSVVTVVAYKIIAVPKITLNKTSGTVGSSVSVSGTGFSANESNVKVTFNSIQAGTTPSVSSNGAWTATFSVPEIPSGSYTVNASGDSSTSVTGVSFTVTPSLNLNPTSAIPGTSITVDGTGFATNEKNIVITYNGKDSNSIMQADENGSWSTRFTIPTTSNGLLKIGAHGLTTSKSSVPEVTFKVNAGISINKAGGPVGASITVSATGFAENETGIVVTFDGSPVSSASITGSPSGAWTANLVVPLLAGGPHTVGAYGNNTTASSIQGITFTVTSSINLSKTSGSAGTSITVTGSGFAANETGIKITYDGKSIGQPITADNIGSWITNFTIPSSSSGTHTVSASGSITQATTSNSLIFDISSSISISPEIGYVGSIVTITGSGFTANSKLTFAYDNYPLNINETGTTDNSGNFKQTITIPRSKTGQHTIKVADQQNNQDGKSFTVDVTNPATPSPKLPEDGEKISLFGNITPEFQWSSVTDPNGGIIYSLQIDTDPEFSSPLLDKTDITNTKYTLSKLEALPRGTYYWRVKAIDAASNQSSWSKPMLLVSGFMSPTFLAAGIVLVIVIIGLALYFLYIRSLLRKRRVQQAAGATAYPEIVIPEAINAEYRTIDSDESSKKRALPWRLALPQAHQAAKGTKTLSPEDQARLKVIVGFARSMPLIELDNNTKWLVDLAENNTASIASPTLYSQLLKNEIQVRYEPAWMRHPTYLDLLTLLEGQPILQDLNSFVESVNRATSEAIIILQDIYRDTTTEITWDIMVNNGWEYISAVYTDAFSWFQCKYLREPTERDYNIKPDSSTGEGKDMFGLYAEQSTPFAGLLVKAPGEKDVIQLRVLHLKLRRNYRNNDRVKDLVNMITQIEVQRTGLLNAFGQFNRLNT